jgi:hypothetical protein
MLQRKVAVTHAICFKIKKKKLILSRQFMNTVRIILIINGDLLLVWRRGRIILIKPN